MANKVPETQEEWRVYLDSAIRQLAYNYQDYVDLVEVKMINLLTKFRELGWEMRRIKTVQKKLVKQHAEVAKRTSQLKNRLSLGQVVMATYRDINAFELAVRNRRAKLRVAKMRNKKKQSENPTQEFIDAVMPNMLPPGTEPNQ